MKPSIGRIVHWCDEEGTVCPAIITEVSDGDYGQNPPSVSLSIFERGCHTMRTLAGVLYSDEYKPDHWTWPPRV